MGHEEQQNAGQEHRQGSLDASPGLKEALAAERERLDAERKRIVAAMQEQERRTHPDQLADSIDIYHAGQRAKGSGTHQDNAIRLQELDTAIAELDVRIEREDASDDSSFGYR